MLDEPFAGVDPIAVIEIQRIISFLKARGIGVLITDHNVRETLGICDRAYIISEGRVLAEGSPSDIVQNAEVRKVYLGEETGNVVVSDTVGFVRDLPHQLVAAFRATLEETIHADLLLHVVDAASPVRLEQIEQVNRVLEVNGFRAQR